MIVLGIFTLVIGAMVAAWVHRQIGLVIAVVGGLLILWALLLAADSETTRAALDARQTALQGR